MKKNFCKCNCGKRVSKLGNKYINGHNRGMEGRHHTEQIKKKMSRTMSGKNNPMRRPEVKAKFIGKNHPRFINGLKRKYPIEFNNQLKQSIRERDNYICQLCGKTQKDNKRKLDVHHIDHNKNNIHPLNLIALCRSCNLVVEYDIDGWMSFFQRKINAKKKAS